MVTNDERQPGEPRASLLVEHWAKQTFAILWRHPLSGSKRLMEEEVEEQEIRDRGHSRGAPNDLLDV